MELFGPVDLTWESSGELFRLLIPCLSLVAQMVNNLHAIQENRVWPLGHEDLLEKGMAIHSSIIAWRISWTVEPGRLWSMGSQRHDWDTHTHTHTCTPRPAQQRFWWNWDGACTPIGWNSSLTDANVYLGLRTTASWSDQWSELL